MAKNEITPAMLSFYMNMGFNPDKIKTAYELKNGDET